MNKRSWACMGYPSLGCWCFLIGIFLPWITGAQGTYTSLEKALDDPSRAFRLELQDKRYKDKTWKKIGELKNVQRLSLSNNQLDTLPEEFGKLSRMSFFKISQNPLKFLPSSIGNWKALNYLELRNTRLDTIPEEAGYWKHLIEWGIDQNKGKLHLPSTIQHLDQLKLLAINQSHLTSFPRGVTGMEKLQKLILSGCKIDSLPASIRNLKRLKVLVLSGNKLKKIPHSIYYLQDLEYLSLRNNLLDDLPENMAHLTNLKELDIRGNYFSLYKVDVLKALLPNCTIKHDFMGKERK